MRITINDETFNKILEYTKEDKKVTDELKKAYKNYLKTITDKKKQAPQKANKAKIKNSKEKVINAINLLRLENKNITAYAIAKVAKVNYATATKYLKELKNHLL